MTDIDEQVTEQINVMEDGEEKVYEVTYELQEKREVTTRDQIINHVIDILRAVDGPFDSTLVLNKKARAFTDQLEKSPLITLAHEEDK